ncbi:RagB/SusD family nutrient uptake outer membrane protein [Coprobacter tertius]|uniref:RagB/SusD family nutrient uptake outer membrane protein n=1 Tax=Coprobacter tertius TaxID=2944915 RepID=A0ABT1MKH6_9BACT|nr:RagB/SusD family nutrient uptake outer membrane protein [Coprobacter tertius]MCP9612519.1 RagB/SusD family nutrient uptake outer membrane protein [Coprobacter tertius]
MNIINIKKSFVAVLTVLLLSGCVDLNEDLTGQPTPDKFFQTLTDFDSFISGAYTPLVILYGTDVPYVAGAGAEDIFTPVVRWKGFEEADINDVGNPDEITNELWNAYYSSISSCNTMIQIIKGNTKFQPEQLNPIEGEALFLRAFNYFQLVRWFGEVPLLLEDNQQNAATEPQVSVSVLYDQIENDLKAAETMLPIKQNDVSRPTRWAAKALLAKVYLARAGFPLNETAYYAKARDKAWEVIENDKIYSLENKFFDLWLWENRMTNTEFIFTFYASSSNGTGGYVNRAVRPSDAVEGGWGDFTGDKRFLEKFPKGDESRVEGTFYLTLSDGTPWEKSYAAQPYVGKLRDGGSKSGGYYGQPTSDKADGFYCMLRYSDLLLIYAESANLAEGAPSERAYDAINKVRRRAGLTDLSGLTTTQFDHAVLDERNWELAFECNRWFDLCRRHILKETIKNYYPDTNIDDHNYLLPKPIAQLTIMTGVRQNPGY